MADSLMPFVKDEAGIGRMLVMPGMGSAMHRRAEAVAELARATAPVDEGRVLPDGRVVPPPHPGRYRDGFVVSSGIRPRDQDPPRLRVRHARAVGRVTNSTPEARFVEFGTERQPARRTLRLALEAARE
jgi:hypothetical protein